MRHDLLIVILKESRTNGKKRWEYNPWTRDYCNMTCIGAFDEADEATAFLQDYADRQVRESESFGWKCCVDRASDGWINSYTCSKGDAEYTTIFYRRCANPNC